MKKVVCFILMIQVIAGHSQKVDSICFHLYTDSLKKGTHNYINVDGKLSNGAWRPMTEKEIVFTSSACEFSGNELVIPPNFTQEKITVKAVLRMDPHLAIEKTIWIKKIPDPEILPVKDETQDNKHRKNKRK